MKLSPASRAQKKLLGSEREQEFEVIIPMHQGISSIFEKKISAGLKRNFWDCEPEFKAISTLHQDKSGQCSGTEILSGEKKKKLFSVFIRNEK